MNEQDFYDECSRILEINHDYEKFPFRKRTRWNNRKAGNGRFENFGLIRMFSPTLIIITSKFGNKTFTNVDQVFEFLKEIRK